MKKIIGAGIIFTTIFSNKAFAEIFGSWFTGISDDGQAVYAATMNDSGNVFGEYCFPEDGNCVWLIGISAMCKTGDQYPVLANTESAASHITVKCGAKVSKDLYSYVFTDFNALKELVMKNVRIGFAIPMQSDNFKVIRFDLTGSNQAIERMLKDATVFQQLNENKNVKSTINQDI